MVAVGVGAGVGVSVGRAVGVSVGRAVGVGVAATVGVAVTGVSVDVADTTVPVGEAVSIGSCATSAAHPQQSRIIGKNQSRRSMASHPFENDINHLVAVTTHPSVERNSGGGHASIVPEHNVVVKDSGTDFRFIHQGDQQTLTPLIEGRSFLKTIRFSSGRGGLAPPLGMDAVVIVVTKPDGPDWSARLHCALVQIGCQEVQY